MISNRVGWHQEGITLKHNSDKMCENRDFCGAVWPAEETKILEFNKFLNLIGCHIFMQILNL